MFKLDPGKALDPISWGFLLLVLEAKGFSRQCRDYFPVMLATSTTKIRINGELSDSVQQNYLTRFNTGGVSVRETRYPCCYPCS